MYGTSFLVPWEAMTLTDIKGYKSEAIRVGVERMLQLKLVTTPDDLTVRSFRANADLGVGTGGQDEWAIALPLLGLNVGVISQLLPANQIVVFYGIDDYDANPVATLVMFFTAIAGGTTKMIVDLQDCRGFTYCAGMLSEPVVYDPQQLVYVSMETDVIHATEFIKFMGYIIEPRGTVVS